MRSLGRVLTRSGLGRCCMRTPQRRSPARWLCVVQGPPTHQLTAMEKLLQGLDRAYYDEGAPLVRDEVYDSLVRQCNALRAQAGLSERPLGQGGRVAGTTVTHAAPMLSISAVHTPQALAAWARAAAAKAPGLGSGGGVAPFVAELKYDGMSVSLTYQRWAGSPEWRLRSAGTRGDGTAGQCITEQVRLRCPLVPTTLPDDVVRRAAEVYGCANGEGENDVVGGDVGGDGDGDGVGELHMFEVRAELILRRVKRHPRDSGGTRASDAGADSGGPRERSLRNVVAGLMTRGMASDIDDGDNDTHVDAVPFSLTFYGPHGQALEPSSQSSQLHALAHMNFCVTDAASEGAASTRDTLPPFVWYLPCGGEEEDVLRALETARDVARDSLWETDGLVLKVNPCGASRHVLGHTHRHPRWATAFKWESSSGVARVQCVEWGVGRSGVLTPVGVLDPPLPLDGTVVRRVTLHSLAWMRTHGVLGTGVDEVRIRKAGGIIPQVVEVMQRDQRVEGEHDASQGLTVCPCDLQLPAADALAFRGDDVCCIRYPCPERVVRGIELWASRPALGVAGIGASRLRQLVRERLLGDPSDLYGLTLDTLVALPGWGERSAASLLTRLLHTPLRKRPGRLAERMWVGLGVPGLGGVNAKALVRHFDNVDSILAATEEDFMRIPGVGPTLASSLNTLLHAEGSPVDTAPWWPYERSLASILDRLTQPGNPFPRSWA